MSSESRIKCKQLTIKFPLFDQASRSVRARLTGDITSPPKSFKALDKISIDIQDGERVGLLGHNGAGKSTFLRTMAGVYPPNSGSLTINGKTSSLFDVSVGVDSDATGYENIPLLMATRGIPHSQLKKVTSDVEQFTELGEALFRPLRTYSSGMRLRIAFAVATYSSNEILLMDEVVGVGDQSFREKSTQRIQDIMTKVGTLIIASHAKSFLTAYTQRGVVFQKGKIAFDGPIEDAISFHEG